MRGGIISDVRWNLLLLHRNQLLVLSLVIAGIYIGVFYLLKDLGSLHKLLILLVFNDPVITGYLFGGIILLMERNQNTLQTALIVPAGIGRYVLSKALALALISLLVALFMVWAAHGVRFNYFHFILSTVLSCLLFTFMGFVVASFSKGFNEFLVSSTLVFILFALPFLPFFEVLDPFWFYTIPSYGSLLLFKASFGEVPLADLAYGYGYLILAGGIMYRWAIKRMYATKL